jgi:hypothetical protein
VDVHIKTRIVFSEDYKPAEMSRMANQYIADHAKILGFEGKPISKENDAQAKEILKKQKDLANQGVQDKPFSVAPSFQAFKEILRRPIDFTSISKLKEIVDSVPPFEVEARTALLDYALKRSNKEVAPIVDLLDKSFSGSSDARKRAIIYANKMGYEHAFASLSNYFPLLSNEDLNEVITTIAKSESQSIQNIFLWSSGVMNQDQFIGLDADVIDRLIDIAVDRNSIDYMKLIAVRMSSEQSKAVSFSRLKRMNADPRRVEEILQIIRMKKEEK